MLLTLWPLYPCSNIHRGFANYERNTGNIHPSAKGLQKRDFGRLGLNSAGLNGWYGTVSVGVPPVDYEVDFTTAISDFFLPSLDCTSCFGHGAYVPGSSWASSRLGKFFTLFYGRHSVTGELYNDTVQIASLTALKQTLGVASSYSPSLSYPSFTADGAIGIGFQSISNYDAVPVLQNIMSQEKVKSSIISLKAGASYAELYIGNTNRGMYKGDIVYTPVTTEAFWQFTLARVKVGGAPILDGVECIIDTETNLIIGDMASVAHLYNALSGKYAPLVGTGFYTFPCDNIVAISFIFSVGGEEFPMSWSNFNLGPYRLGSTDCIGGIVDHRFLGVFSLPYWILGQTFLTDVYTVFDIGNSRIGFGMPTF